VRLIRLLVPANIRHNSGGNVYNARLVQGLGALGAAVEVLPVGGSWPEASARERRRLGSLLGAWEPGPEESGVVTLVDGLIAVGAPDEMEFAAKAGRETWVLVHMPVPAKAVPDNSDAGPLEREARALRAARGVICTSTSAAATLEARHGIPGLRVALPGTDASWVAEGSVPPHIVAVAALLPNKDQLLIVEALARLQQFDWTASLVGSDEADPEYAGLVRAAVEDHGLSGRVQLTGELTGEALDDEWNRADLTVLVSRAEAFGLVVTESLARGIPAIVRDGTGAIEALGFAAPSEGGRPRLPGTAVPFPAPDDPANPALLAEVMGRWMEDGTTRNTWRAAALETRARLPGWERTAAQVLDAIGG
jgi:glycosyltransferase involved in cell wall biosynthesis